MKRTYLRLLGALFATALVAAACGDSTTTDAAAAVEESAIEAAETTASDTTGDNATDDHSHDDDATDDNPTDDHSHDDDEHAHEGEDTLTLEVAEGAPIPAVEIELTETDTAGTFDLAVELTNFTITPDNVDGEPIDNEGHMHLLIDGVKIERFTDVERQVIVAAGEHLIEVELNANNHAAYAVDGEPIRAGLTVIGHDDSGDATDVAEVAANDGHSHAHGPASSGIEDGLAVGDESVAVNASFAAGAVLLDGEERIDAAVGDVVLIAIESDVAEQAHLHGYDILVDVAPGEPATILLTADTPGKFEIEFEESGAFIAELVVS